MTLHLTVDAADAGLDQRLSAELDSVNAVAVPGPGAVELTVRSTDEEGELLGGISGWTWQEAAASR